MWLIQEGPNSEKHTGKLHPIVTFVAHYCLVLTTTVIAHDTLVNLLALNGRETSDGVLSTVVTNCLINDDDNNNGTAKAIEQPKQRQLYIAYFLLMYSFTCLCVRLALKWKTKHVYRYYSEFYQMTFLCSVTIINTAVGFLCDRPVMAQAFCLAVGIDQFLWYIDLFGYFTFGVFPAGVCKYLFRNHWLNRITSCHHLWTVPLVFWGCGCAFHWLALPLSAHVIILNVILSRLMTPISIAKAKKKDEDDDDSDDEGLYLYLNINLSHEMWSDVTFFNPTPYAPYLMRLIFWWYSSNMLVYGALCAISRKIHCD